MTETEVETVRAALIRYSESLPEGYGDRWVVERVKAVRRVLRKLAAAS